MKLTLRRHFLLACVGTSLLGGAALRPSDAAAPPVQPLPTVPQTPAAAADPRVATINAYLNEHCVSCHGPTKRKADLTLHTYTDPTAILKGRKVFLNSLKMIHAGEMPPEDREQPPHEQTEAFFVAVNGLYADADRSAKPDPGRVTVRRLNRVEYNNTVRDLLGIELTPADDFPADDVGNGFDNIGDVLTVSPVLMERYLAAAENVSTKAIVLEVAKAANRSQRSRNLEPTGPRVPDGRFRPVPKGELSTKFRPDLDGDYVLRARVLGKSPDDQKVRVTLSMDGKPLTTVEVTGTTEKDASTIRHPLKLTPGEHKFAVGIANPSDGAAELDVGTGPKRANIRGEKPPAAMVPAGVRVLYVEEIALDGPADTRPPSHRRLLSYADASADQATQTRQIVAKLASRAYRRPATELEIDGLAKLVGDAVAGGDKWEGGLQLAVEAILTSPKFLFRLELDDRPTSPEPRPLDDYALASRLSYFLWASMPDDELFDLAAKKKLSGDLEKQVRRMLKDPRATSLVDNFAMQWLQLKRLRTITPDAKAFPEFDEQLRNAMARETELFINAVVKEDRSILDLLDANYSFMNERLARHYGIADTQGNPLGAPATRPPGDRLPRDEFLRVNLPPGDARGGILTQASVLMVTSNPGRTSPVKRGKWVLEQILGTPPPPPPPNVPELPETGKALSTASLRQRLEEHRANPSCANCHAKMDPIGFAFENFDAVGGFRKKDGGFDIDASGVLPDGKKFTGAAELKAVLKEKKDLFARALAEKMLTYALGRGLEFYDDRAVDEIAKGTAAGEYRFAKLVTEIVKSEPFRLRRGLKE